MGNVETTLGQLEVDRDKSEVYEDWMMAPGELDGAQVTVFSAAHPSSSRKRPYIERALQASRVYRHPGLLRYLDGGVVGGEVVVVTERATPLRHHTLDTFSPLHISAGLQSIIETLVFLHDRAGVSHNNVSASSIFVTPDGAWKLWGLEYSCSFGKLTRDHVEHTNSYCHERAVPPDDKARISPSYQHARDSYAFGHLVEDVLTAEALTEVGGAADFLALVKKSCLATAPTQRPRLAELAEHSVFSHAFLKLHDTLTNILLLTDQKREEFLTSVADSLEQYPEELVSSTLAGALLSRPVLLHPAAATHLMPRVLTPRNGPKREKNNHNEGEGDETGEGGGEGVPGGGGGGGGGAGLFSEEVFRRNIVPQVVRLFGVHDATVRGTLLAHLPSYVSLLPRDVLAEDVLPELLLGIRDSSDALVSATLHALAHLVPILGASVVVGENRHNLFTTAKPKAAALLPLTKGVSSSLAKEPLVNGIKVVTPKPLPTPSASPRSPELTPPPPPPRSISLAGAEAASDAASLDNLSLDSLALAHIPERSSPDGGEDSTNPAVPSLVSPGLGGEVEAWSSDWEDMQEGVGEVFKGPTVLPPKDVHSGWSVSLGGGGEMDDVFSQTLHPATTAPNDTPPPTQHGKTSSAPRQSSGMKLVGLGKKEPPTAPTPKRPPSLGEEFDVLAIKVNKKRDAELDLFADLAPSFTTKKFDLETMLVEANCRAKGVPLARTPSVSETLAGLDTKMGEEAWGDEGGWGDPLDLPEIPSPPSNTSNTSSPAKSSTNWESEPWPDLTGPDLPSEANGVARDVTPSVPQRPVVKDGWNDNWGEDF
ncbi:protein-associating with the carboxyl-terminal domain of ezrin-like [Eriocheir sinensis]|uniref:protein-associating with the carboxyl-terminal domain of ezrin-like n=1 Tax=Eriocheir sinensis TaxID=95602 RepID=UPI0021C65079|nr:protein-associating with the carboxyl-terminal domain of ezrin-like [Eriocheir sinensis]